MSNGSNSNTSGASVANIGFWPRGIIQKFRDFLAGTVADLNNVLAGGGDPAQVDFSEKGATDAVADSVMEEISRRLIVTFETGAGGNVVFSVTPPSDLSKVWWPIDPATQIPIGSPKTWNSTLGQWVDVQTQASAYVPPKRRYTSVFAPAAQSQQTAHFESIGTTDYSVIVTPTTLINGNWQPGPSAFPSHFGFMITGKAENELTIAFFGTPTGGASFEIDIMERIRSGVGTSS